MAIMIPWVTWWKSMEALSQEKNTPKEDNKNLKSDKDLLEALWMSEFNKEDSDKKLEVNWVKENMDKFLDEKYPAISESVMSKIEMVESSQNVDFNNAVKLAFEWVDDKMPIMAQLMQENPKLQNDIYSQFWIENKSKFPSKDWNMYWSMLESQKKENVSIFVNPDPIGWLKATAWEWYKKEGQENSENELTIDFGQDEKPEEKEKTKEEIEEQRIQNNAESNKYVLMMKNSWIDQSITDKIVENIKWNEDIAKEDILKIIDWEDIPAEEKNKIKEQINWVITKFEDSEKNTKDFDEKLNWNFDEEFEKKLNPDDSKILEKIKWNFVLSSEQPTEQELQNAFNTSMQIEVSEITKWKKNIPDKLINWENWIPWIRQDIDMVNNLEVWYEEKFQKLLEFKSKVNTLEAEAAQATEKANEWSNNSENKEKEKQEITYAEIQNKFRTEFTKTLWDEIKNKQIWELAKSMDEALKSSPAYQKEILSYFSEKLSNISENA